MSIKRMLLLASMALAAIAFAAPAASQANIVLTDEEIELEAGAEITATSTNLTTTSEVGLLSCELVTLHLELTDPGPEHLVFEQLGEAGTSECEEEISGLPVTITDGTVFDDITLNTWGIGTDEDTTNASFISHVMNAEHNEILGTCSFEGPVHIEATTPDIIDVVITLGGPCGPAVATGSFTLETKDKTPVNIDFEHTS